MVRQTSETVPRRGYTTSTSKFDRLLARARVNLAAARRTAFRIVRPRHVSEKLRFPRYVSSSAGRDFFWSFPTLILIHENVKCAISTARVVRRRRLTARRFSFSPDRPADSTRRQIKRPTAKPKNAKWISR